MSLYTLYGRPGSGSLAVQVALEELGASYERIWIANDPTEVATWFPSGTAKLYARLPSLGLHAQKIALRPAVLKVVADHAV